jgi:HSF-type DNA-binding
MVMADDERDAPLLLNMTMSSSTTENDSRKSSPDKDLSKASQFTSDRHFSQSSHSGLSALLNAVTLQLSKSKEEEQEKEELEKANQWKKNGELSSLERKSFDTTKEALHTTTSTIKTATTTATITTTTPPTRLQKQQSYSKATAATAATIATSSTAATTTTTTTFTTLPSSFPQKLMTLLMNSDHENAITWLPDGKYFAIRSNGFHTTILHECFGMDSIESFLSELHMWGFAVIETQRVGIEVFRHQLFRKGDWDQCHNMHRLDVYSTNDENDPEGGVLAKRRLSPGHWQSSEDSDESSRKLRMQDSGSPDRTDDHEIVRRRRTLSKDHRYLARAITTEKLQIQPTGESDKKEICSLAQQAIIGATHTIVTDAIETLLNDEEHTRMCFAIHAEELSKSTIPGLVPIAKQLFSTTKSATRHEENKTSVNTTRYNGQYQRNEEPLS